VVAKAPVKPRQIDLWGSGTILLVEDEDMVRAVAERALTRQGYTVVAADRMAKSHSRRWKAWGRPIC
jgi:two-component system cell cycle sensor histidine kinase/response regulator CckA